jgi:hypothetical protein
MQGFSDSKEGYSLRRDRVFWAIVLAGALVRLGFLVFGSKVYYGPGQGFINGDTSSYVMSFTNLLKHGTYTFDFLEPDAAFGRLPGYPFFYGIHYLIFGPAHAMQATACSQAFLDCLSIALIFLIVRKLISQNPKQQLAPYIAAALYAFYPFIFIWTTVIGTELLATFMTLVWLYTLLSPSNKWPYYALLGIEIAFLFYIREFLGIFLPITCLYLLLSRINWRVAVRNCAFVGVGFAALYMWWPVRNYVYQHRIMLVKPQRAGFANYKTDMTSFLDWVHSWSNQSSYWLQQVLSESEPDFPNDIFASPQERSQAVALTKRANECGSSFYIYKHGIDFASETVNPLLQSQDYTVECNEEIRRGFDQLRESFKARNPVAYYTRVPLQNLYKVFFKSGLESGSKNGAGNLKLQLIMTAVFGYRTILLILGVIGLVIYRRVMGLQPIIAFWVFIVVFLCFYFRQLEMRYLIQADVLLLVPAALLLDKWISRWPRVQRLILPNSAGNL